MKKFKIGVFGTGHRGQSLAETFMKLNGEIVALCEQREEKLLEASEKFGKEVPTFTDFDEFLKTDMDALILANYFHEHAPYAIKCLEKGIGVFSECISNGTMAEGVELVRAAEKSKAIYFLAENYPQMLFNREMKRVVDGGTLGKIIYAEGEYNHPVDPYDMAFKRDYVYFDKHWRNYLPTTYYIPHSLGPVMRATGATPKRVCAMATTIPFSEDTPTVAMSIDRMATIITQNDDGSVFRITGCAKMGCHHTSYRVAGTNGTIENIRGMAPTVMLRYNAWQIPEGMQEINHYTPEWNDKDEELIKKSGHGGGDYALVRDFIEAVALQDPGKLSSSIDASIESHIMGFAAEKSRKSNKKAQVKM
jgi:predicted dehydrogenase